MKNKILLPLLLASLVFIGISCPFKRSAPTPTTQEKTVEEFKVTDQQEKILSDEFSRAQSYARFWSTDIRLASFEITYENELKNAPDTYVFISNKEPFYYWTVKFNRTEGTFYRSIIPKEDYGKAYPALKDRFWKISADAALLTAEKNGGNDFRKKHEKFKVSQILGTDPKTNFITWFITYESGTDKLEVIIDASTGTINK